jgi:hypothetical protein
MEWKTQVATVYPKEYNLAIDVKTNEMTNERKTQLDRLSRNPGRNYWKRFWEWMHYYPSDIKADFDDMPVGEFVTYTGIAVLDVAKEYDDVVQPGWDSLNIASPLDDDIVYVMQSSTRGWGSTAKPIYMIRIDLTNMTATKLPYSEETFATPGRVPIRSADGMSFYFVDNMNSRFAKVNIEDIRAIRGYRLLSHKCEQCFTTKGQLYKEMGGSERVFCSIGCQAEFHNQ